MRPAQQARRLQIAPRSGCALMHGGVRDASAA
jgi:hypothetical protein